MIHGTTWTTFNMFRFQYLSFPSDRHPVPVLSVNLWTFAAMCENTNIAHIFYLFQNFYAIALQALYALVTHTVELQCSKIWFHPSCHQEGFICAMHYIVGFDGDVNCSNDHHFLPGMFYQETKIIEILFPVKANYKECMFIFIMPTW
jgi:hypothetical protein